MSRIKSICAICGKEVTGIGNHVQYKHVRYGDIESTEEYYRRYLYKGDPDKLGKCVTCGKDVPFISILRGYHIHCCHDCSQKDPEVKQRKKENTKKALLEKYGVEYAAQIPGAVQKAIEHKIAKYGSSNNDAKRRQTCLERYGVENPSQCQEIVDRRIKTNLEKYGTAFPANSEENIAKIKARNLEQYGVEWAQQRPEIKAKSVQTSIERYGGVLMSSPELQKKIRVTWKEKYGTDHPNKNPEQAAKKYETNVERYGVQNPLELPRNHEKARASMLKKYGHEYAMQVPEFFEKQKRHAKGVYNLRYYTFKTGKTLSYLSNMEKAFLEDCDERGYEVDRGDQVIYNFNGGEHIFNVDFKIKKNGIWQLVEIKGTNSFYYEAEKTGIQEAKNQAAIEYSERLGYLPYLYLLNYNKGEIERWI